MAACSRSHLRRRRRGLYETPACALEKSLRHNAVVPRTVLIVGSGPAAAGAALACMRRDDVVVTVLDVGEHLEPDREAARQRLASVDPNNWDPVDLDMIRQLPNATKVKGPPQKRSYGSDFPFRDAGQRNPVEALDGANDVVVSGAYGGYSTVWGAQIMPFSKATFHTWPVDAEEMYEHYSMILSAIPYAAEADDLATNFPLLASAARLPQVSERTSTVLGHYGHHRQRLRESGVIVGRARLAFDAVNCRRCGLCMSGCPYLLIYSAAQTFDQLCGAGRVRYLSGHIALAVEEDANRATVVARELRTNRIHRFHADHVFLAAGAFGPLGSSPVR